MEQFHSFYIHYREQWAFQVALVVKNLPANAGDMQDTQGSIPGLGGFPWGGNGNPLQYSSVENPMDWGDWQAIVLGLTKESDMAE